MAESEASISRRTTLLGREVSLEDHRQPAGWAKDFRRRIVTGRRGGGLLFNRIKPGLAKADLQSNELATDRSAKETVIAHLDKGMREDMLEETLKELFDRKGASFELSGIGGAVLKGDLGSLHSAAVVKGKQATIADGNPMDIRSEILEGGLTICHRLAMHDPLLRPDLGRDLLKEFHFLQTASETSAK